MLDSRSTVVYAKLWAHLMSSPVWSYFNIDPTTCVSTLVVTVRLPDISAALARACPLNPRESPPTFLRSSRVSILLVKLRLQTKLWSSGGMPCPLSFTWITSTVFCEISTDIEEAEASRALSSSSLTTEHASERTDVEPIAWTVDCGRAAIGMSKMSLSREASQKIDFQSISSEKGEKSMMVLDQ